jgi:hypothetical protein
VTRRGGALAWAVFTPHPAVIVVALVAVLAQFLGEVQVELSGDPVLAEPLLQVRGIIV